VRQIPALPLGAPRVHYLRTQAHADALAAELAAARHLAVVGGAPATVLYSAASDPSLTAPRGHDVVILRKDDLADLSVDEVAATLGLAP